METNTRTLISQQELQASLERLGIRELEERMEVSPLLAAPDVQVTDRCDCCWGCSTVDVPDIVIDVGLNDDISGINHTGY